MKNLIKTVYNFDELSDEAKEKARSWYRDGALDYEWYDSVFEDSKTIGKILGIDIDKIYFSGFSSQGDGAMFEGHYAYAKDSIRKIKEYAPQDTELHRIARSLYELQKPNFYRITAKVSHRGMYYHSLSNDIEIYGYDNQGFEYWLSNSVNDGIKETLRDFMNWIYRTLEKEYDFLMSDEQVDESITINEYTFDENGNREG